MTFPCSSGLLRNPPLSAAGARAAGSPSPARGQSQSLGTRQALGSMLMGWKWGSAPAVCCPSGSAPAAAQGGGRELSSQSPFGCSRGAQTPAGCVSGRQVGKNPIISPWRFLGTRFLLDFGVFIRWSIPSSATHSWCCRNVGVHILHLRKARARAGLKAQFPHPSLESPIHVGVTPFPMILG